MNDSLLIGCAADEAFAPGLAVAARSLLERLPRGIGARLWIVDAGLAAATKENLRRSWEEFAVDLTWIPFDVAPVRGLKTEERFPPVTYARLLLPGLLPSTERRLLYLDSDLLVRADVRELWRTDLRGAAFGAVQDLGCLTVSEPLYGLRNFRELGLPADQPYCNAGVLLIDLPRWRAERISERVIEYVAANPDAVQWPEQDGLNAVAGSRWTALDPRWNSLVGSLRTSSALSWSDDRVDQETLARFTVDPAIVHFIGPEKPWKVRTRHPQDDEYRKILRKTAFAS